ncbi:uncharacterized protein LOC123541956 [Mercenaria mercenaria]|uniref:uncharacterized protein LOC123541956 n=1 Tax=Mercenaria mercenaria TaxID=6596 RepID=UPI00234F64F7|nr:uncharacterized protein LOC123541956 [Mercenaria mercenaria]
MRRQNISAGFIFFSVLISLRVRQSYSVETYSLSYNYNDEVAQSYCASKGTGWVFAIRRDCEKAPRCKEMCNNVKKEILESIGNARNRQNGCVTSVSCFDAFQIKKSHPVLKVNPSHQQPDSGKLNLGTYGYGSDGCTWGPNHCGPNYCCCKAY